MKNGNFAWVGHLTNDEQVVGSHPRELVESIVRVLRQNAPIALGFECPTFVPVPNDAAALGKGRHGEGSRPWSAGAGTGSLATGIVQIAWIAREVMRLHPPVEWTFDAEAFAQDPRGVLVWEAFISGAAKTSSHHGDAEAAIECFVTALENGFPMAKVHSDYAFSLAGAALLFAGATDLQLLSSPCYVVTKHLPHTHHDH